MKEKSIGFYIGALQRGAHKYFERYLKPMGIHRGMLHVLMELRENSPRSQTEINERLVTDKANTARLMMKMEEQGLIERHCDPMDRRNKIVQLTGKGREKIEPAAGIIQRWVDLLTTGMDQGEKACFLSLLQRSFINVEKYFEVADGG